MTHAATKFIAPLTFEVLSEGPVSIDLFEAHHEMKHLCLPEQADLIVVAPATAHFRTKAASGLADDLLSLQKPHSELCSINPIELDLPFCYSRFLAMDRRCAG